MIVQPGIDQLPPKRLPQNRNTHPNFANHFVFIDVRVPDLDTLIHGAVNDRDVHVLAVDRDGLRQIADILDASAASASSIAIVAHGAPGVLTIGDTKLGAADLASRATVLAEIGDALAPQGRIDLYACDLAAGPDGPQFISEFARQTGVHVAGATHPLGSLDGNGCWTLDVTTGGGAIEIPFTAAAREAHRGVLTDPTIDTQLFYTLNTGTGSSVLRLDTDSVTHAIADLQSLYSTTQTLGDIVIDTSSGLYFFIQSQGTVNEGKLSQPNVIQTFAVQFDEVSLAIDPSRGKLYDGFF